MVLRIGRFAVVAVSAAVLLSAGACSSLDRTGQAGGEIAPTTRAATVRVVNDNFHDVDVYVVRDGSSTRIGSVIGNSSGTFRLDRSLFPTNDVSLAAVPVGGFGRASSGRVTIYPGDEIEFRITPVIDQSHAVVRPPSRD
jgi:hypothetical protein